MITTDLHLKSPKGWINDPNGFIYYQGKYHMFYQHYPHATHWGKMHWGHALSTDLVHWEHQNIALYPSVTEDQHGCFSGSAIEHDGKMYIYYTGIYLPGYEGQDLPRKKPDTVLQSAQLMIVSEDGMSFDNEHGKKVIIPALTDPEIGNISDARDPKVWRGKDAWYLVFGTTTPEHYGQLNIFKSEDLENWTFAGKTSTKDRGWMWECPDYFETKGGEAVIFSPFGLDIDILPAAQTLCMTAHFDEETCSLTLSDKFDYIDYGKDIYAPQSAVDKDGNRVLFAWIRMPAPINDSWIGALCLPRVVTVENDRVKFAVHPNVYENFVPLTEETPDFVNGKYMLQLTLDEGSSISLGGYRIFLENHRLKTDRSEGFPENVSWDTFAETPEIIGECHLEIFIDGPIIEIFVNKNEASVTQVTYGRTEKLELAEAKDVQIFQFR